MAIGVIIDFPGATLEQYDQTLKLMGLSPGGPGGAGGLFHWATPTSNGFRVIDVWRDKESFERFAAEQIGPRTAEAGITTQPEIQFFEVHNYLTAAD